jgi:hypothetical protein
MGTIDVNQIKSKTKTKTKQQSYPTSIRRIIQETKDRGIKKTSGG